ncbi:hypothetical protein GQD58_003987 [Salmonella enterica]|nr:hypothetical protein [Salmonella enterica]
MLPSETMIWQPEFTDKTLSRKPGAVHFVELITIQRFIFGVIREPLFIPAWNSCNHEK